MSRVETLSNYIETVYNVLSPEEVFSRAKEYAWQTFFHHSISVALISYCLGTFIKKNAPFIAKKAIESIEKNSGLKYEDVLYLAGIAHDYVKLYGIENKTGRERICENLSKIINELTILSPELKKEVISKLILIARAVEGKSDPALEEEYVLYVARVVSVADALMGKSSLDEALSYLYSSKDVIELIEDYNLRFGFVKISLPSILHAKISEKIVELLQANGWAPLVIYADGLLLLGTRTSRSVPLREIVEVIKKEVRKAFQAKESIEALVKNLERKALNDIYSLLVQTNAEELLPIDEAKGKSRGKRKEDPRTKVYHNLIVMYLKGTHTSKLEETLRKYKGRRKTLIDPRTLATGLEKSGSTYFEEKLATLITSRDDLAEIVVSLEDERKRFLILAYMIAFPVKETSVIADILQEALGIILPRTLDPELIRIIAIAEAYRNRDNPEAIRKLVETVYEKTGGSLELDYYISKFVLSKLKSNIVDTESLSTLDVLIKRLGASKNYCRICGEPILSSSIRYIQYARTIGKGGGASEIWLHDDPPLASLEKLATDKATTIRYICPLCLYEAVQLRGRYSPPFFVVALHPVVAYDLWNYLKGRLEYLRNIYELKERKYAEVVRIYKKVLGETKLKVTGEVLREIAERSVSTFRGKERIAILFDSLGARVFLPLGKDLSLKRKYVAFVLALAPFVMSLSGGGQVGLVSNLGDAYNLGSEIAPLVMPHPSNMVLSIVGTFEKIKEYAERQGRKMNLDEYSVYNQSYITLLEALYIYGLKIFSWCIGWRQRTRGEIEEYALALHDFMSSIPYVPLALDTPPPERLDPRKGDEALPYYGLISSRSLEVESRMSQAEKVLGGELPSLNRLLYRYAVSLKELRSDLSRYRVQRPLRRGIELLLQYALTIGEDDAKGIAIDKFLELVARSTEVDLESRKKVIRDETGKEREVSYRTIFFNIFKDLADALLEIRKRIPSSKMRELIEVMLDSAYEKYKYAETTKQKAMEEG